MFAFKAKARAFLIITAETLVNITDADPEAVDPDIAPAEKAVKETGRRASIREKLPEGFQRAEYLSEHGMVDMVVHRHKLRATLAELCRLLTRTPPPAGHQQLPAPAHA